MSAFCVFGMTESLAKTLAARKAPPKKELEKMTAEDLRQWYADRAAKIFESAKHRQVSPEFDAPQFCHDWIELANKTVKSDGLIVMFRGPKPDAAVSKRTGKPLMTWAPINYSIHLSFINRTQFVKQIFTCFEYF